MAEHGKAGGSASSVEQLQEQLRELEAENRLLRQVCSASTMPLPLPNRQVRWPLEVSLDVAAAWHSSLPRDVPLHVLVVDGDMERRRSVRALAQQANAQADSVLSIVVSEAASPDEALGQLDSCAGSCDLILLDAALLDTESTSDKLRFARLRRLARDHVPIVVVCESAAGASVGAWLLSGIDALLTRPLVVGHLASVWQHCVRRDGLFFARRAAAPPLVSGVPSYGVPISSLVTSPSLTPIGGVATAQPLNLPGGHAGSYCADADDGLGSFNSRASGASSLPAEVRLLPSASDYVARGTVPYGPHAIELDEGEHVSVCRQQ
jgi:CheY-like chemotaxis protein